MNEHCQTLSPFVNLVTCIFYCCDVDDLVSDVPFNISHTEMIKG